MKYLLILPGVLVLLVLIAVVRTLVSPRKTSDYQPPQTDEAEALRLAGKLSKMIQVDTTSHAGGDDPARFRAFHKTLAELFPRVFSQLEKTEIDGNLLFYWKGRSQERPILLMSHQDVVPAEGAWSHAPFSGDIADGQVWGRGASDAIISEPIGGIPGNFAMVGVFEKGKADVKFTAKSTGGHASAPGRHTPIARLAAFVTEVETHSPFKKKLLPEVAAMFRTLAPYASSFGLRLLLGNLWLFAPLLKLVLPAVSAQAGAMLRTTIAFTTQSGSDAYNVIPQEATLGANMRFIPHQGEQESLALIQTLAEKHGLSTEVLHANDFTPPVDIHGEAFTLFTRVIGETFPGLAASPYVMTGATDAQFYQPICKSCIRFAPVIYGPEQMRGMHGLNENIEYRCLPGAVRFYQNLIRAEK